MLAPETIEAIIHHLHNDRRSLSACSLTCKQRHPRRRYLLFSDVHVNVEAFRELLEEASSDIALLVQRLVLALGHR